MTLLSRSAGRLRSVLRPISNRLFALPPDKAARWSPRPPGHGKSLDILRVGSCDFREIEVAHTMRSPPGYPVYLGEELARSDIGFGWQNIFAWNIEDLPDAARMRELRGERGDPDVVVLGVGLFYAMRHVLGHDRRMVALRENGARWAGPLLPAILRINVVLLRWFGRTYPYHGTAKVEDWIADVRTLWPRARVLVQEPIMTFAYDGAFDERLLRVVRDDLHALVERVPDVEWLPAPSVGADRGLRAWYGVLLNRRGSELVGRYYADWFVRHGYPAMVSRPRRT